MPFQLPFLGRRQVMPNKPIAITELGKKKQEEMMVEGPKYDILTKLNENGPSSVNELAQETQHSPSRVRDIVKELIRNGYASPVNTGS